MGGKQVALPPKKRENWEMRISVVIPCLNEEENIGGLVALLKEQDFPREEFEIIVVNNASVDDTQRVAEEAGADKVLPEGRKGTNFARQAGLEAASAEIVAFLDADCRPPKDWLKKIWNIFEEDKEKRLGILSGPYRYYDVWFITRFFSSVWQRAMIWFLTAADLIFRRKWAIALGGNMAVRKSIIQSMGGFDVKFTSFGDDADTALRIKRAGYRTRFDRAIILDSSARRFKKRGLVRTAAIYTLAYTRLYFGRSKPLKRFTF